MWPEFASNIWDIPYSCLEPVYAADQDTEMTMRSFGDDDNEAIKAYFEFRSSIPEVPDFPDGSPEFHIMKAICELWRKLDDANLERECSEMMEKEGLKPGPKRQPATIMRDIQARYADMINKLFSALGREVPRSVAERWEKSRNQKSGTIYQ